MQNAYDKYIAGVNRIKNTIPVFRFDNHIYTDFVRRSAQLWHEAHTSDRLTDSRNNIFS